MSRSILWADGDSEFTDCGREYLEHHGYIVRTVTVGSDCTEILQCSKPDLLILDDELIWGNQQRILDSVDVSVLLVNVTCDVILTSDDPRWLADRGVDLSRLQHLRKPFNLYRLLELVQSLPEDDQESRHFNLPCCYCGS